MLKVCCKKSKDRLTGHLEGLNDLIGLLIMLCLYGIS